MTSLRKLACLASAVEQIERSRAIKRNAYHSWKARHPEGYRQNRERSVQHERLGRLFALVASNAVPEPYTAAQLGSSGRSPVSRFIVAENRSNLNERRCAHDRRRRARKAGAEATLTRAEWLMVLAYHNEQCVWCGTDWGPFDMDHVVPLALGGPHSADNVAPACATCNTSKRDRNPAEFFERGALRRAA